MFTLRCTDPDNDTASELNSESLCNLIVAAMRTCSLTSAELALIANEAEAEEQRRFMKRRELEIVPLPPVAFPLLSLYDEILRAALQSFLIPVADPRLQYQLSFEDLIPLVVQSSDSVPPT